MNNYSFQIMRAVRKFYQLKQVDFAPIIQTSQSALSKIEAGILELSASQWLSVCEKFSLDPRCLFNGKIENLGDRKIKVQSLRDVGGYQIPKQYSHMMGSSVRTAYPLIKFMRMRLGDKVTGDFLKSAGFDPDYFLIMNNPLNLKFIEHLVLFLISKGVLSISNVGSIIDLISFKDIHSSVVSELGNSLSIDTAAKKLLSRVKLSYEQNTFYEFEGGKNFVVAKDEDFIKDFKLSSEFNSFRQSFNLAHFQGLNEFMSEGQNVFKSKTISDGWVIIKAS